MQRNFDFLSKFSNFLKTKCGQFHTFFFNFDGSPKYALPAPVGCLEWVGPLYQNILRSRAAPGKFSALVLELIGRLSSVTG